MIDLRVRYRRLISIAALIVLVSGMAYAQVFNIFNAGAINYTGLVATRGKLLASYDTSNNQMMARSFHYTRTAVTSLQVRFGCWYVFISTDVESAPGSDCVIKGDVEYPVGVCHPLTFSGMSSVTVAKGTDVLSDPINITIPTNTNASGLIYSDEVGDWATGDLIDVGVSGIADHTVDCGTVPLTVGFMSFPLTIVGKVPNAQASVCLLGDSIVDGAHDVYSGTSGDVGILARSVGPTLGYVNMGISNDTSSRFNAGHTQRDKELQYCTSAISGYGHNNFAADGESLAVMEASLATMYTTLTANMIGSKTIIQTTIIPWTTDMANNWTTTVDQMTTAFQTSVAGFNTDLLAATVGPPGGSYNTSSILGTGTNNSLWIVDGTDFYSTADGVHPSPGGYGLIQSSGIIDTSRLH
jgi:lysophospholipase L1-like esterase